MISSAILTLGVFLPSFANPETLIRSADLRSHVYFLASDELQGRESGTEQERVASEYLARTLDSFGVKPANGAEGFFQSYEFDNVQSRNVVGWIEGSDPELKKEYVILGAHYDHVGLGAHNSLSETKGIHNGADDNASGTASLLELAQAFSSHPPKRSILIIHFSGEEEMLQGSNYYCKNPILPLENAVAMLNMDMLGRSTDNYLFVGGTGTGVGFKELIEEKANGTGLQLETSTGGQAPSDNTGFYLHQIPVLFFFTNIHDDYHAPGDDWWKLNYEGQETITRLVFRLADGLANETGRRAFRYDGKMALPKDFMERMSKIRQKTDKKRVKRKPREKGN